MKETILITGVAGLLGSRLADWIIENKPEYKVVGIDDLSGGYMENVHKDVHFWKMDLTDKNIENCFKIFNPKYVFHFAAYAAEGLSPFIRTYNYTNNLLATANIVNNCINHNVKRLVFTSTMAVYGHGEGGILLGIWMYYHMEGQPITIFGDGTQKRAFSYIDDSLEPLWNAAIKPEASKQIINLGGIHEYSINEAADILSEVLGGAEKVYLEGRHEVHTAVPTFQKSIDILGFEHKTEINNNLKEIDLYGENMKLKKEYIVFGKSNIYQ
jgi:UDP-glucose 4-epimerase